MKRPKGGRRGTLHIIGGLMVMSAVVRIMGAGQAYAAGDIAHEAEPVAAESTTETPAAASSMEDNAALLDAIRQREARIAEKEAQLENRMQALQLAEKEASERVIAMTAAEESLKSTIALADVAAENDIARLVAVYENMKPKEAAALFSQMTPDFAAGFLGLMNPVIAAQILSLVSPESAYSISVVLAGRNAGIPTK